MLVVSIILGFAVLALGLLTLLDRYETAVDKAHADRRANKTPKLVYYDAFPDRRPASADTPSRE
ncbi:MAG TPA: hypothetical protein VGD97_07170 [Lacunisphaera sp.]